MTSLDSVLNSRDIILLTNIRMVKAMVFSNSHVQMWETDHKESWEPKNWCFWIVMLEKTLESPLDCKEIKTVNPKGNQSWIFIGMIDAEAPILWSPDAKSWLTGKDPDAGEDWGQKEQRAREKEMAGWHHWLNGHEFEQALGVNYREAGELQSVGSQRVRYDLLTELWTIILNREKQLWKRNYSMWGGW